MANITIYTKTICPFCVKAKGLLKSKGAEFTEISIEGSDDLRTQMIERANGAMTVPQIFIDDYHVGGCDNLFALESRGELDKILV